MQFVRLSSLFSSMHASDVSIGARLESSLHGRSLAGAAKSQRLQDAAAARDWVIAVVLSQLQQKIEKNFCLISYHGKESLCTQLERMDHVAGLPRRIVLLLSQRQCHAIPKVIQAAIRHCRYCRHARNFHLVDKADRTCAQEFAFARATRIFCALSLFSGWPLHACRQRNA